ncbi:MAG TPA: hypothetical protein VH183_12640 [Burkholderiaceae bacterium]|nr:hypothetical protein [Burkholderiaceae bacterium]
MSATPDPNDAEAVRLRAAHELLDERPSPRVRAAVLRAAAESVGGDAAPESVGAPRRRPARAWFGWGPAAAAGATIAVGILAIGISVHVEHETPIESRTAPAAAPMAPAPAAPVDEAKPAAAATPAPRPAVPAVPPSVAKQLKARPAEATVATPDAGASQSQKSSGAQSAGAISNSPEPAPRAPTQTGTRMRMMQAPAMQAAPQAGESLTKPRQADQAGSSSREADMEPARLTPSPDDWLRRIVELRRAGRNAEADGELARFRAAFPNVKVPDAAAK